MARSQFVGFRASAQFSEAVEAAAGADGVSKSEFLRQAVEDRLAKAGASQKVSEDFNPYAALAPAARGSLQAQRDLANAAIDAAFTTNNGELVNDPLRCLIEGLVFARLAAAHGEVADQGLVISIVSLLLSIAGDEGGYEADAAEAIARIAKVADMGGEGSDLAAENLPHLVDGFGQGVTAAAQHITKLMQA
ncbi:hypothetical protein [Qipengyuania oceanensis]|uniref:Ribbon-helix-helix protein, CopG family n=1 Tax=Qipengyuania oceanensis TaxID=1463597 RepID=A0A844YHP4_9SPHN|nr:hypothetical protein [Qipengyuania oceanensis]MXO63422.1 hypothetical protein [Qipengyuania oceanensis]